MRLLILLLVLIFSTSSLSANQPARVIGVIDGDTIRVLVDEKQVVKIRLAEIDTPEKRQPYGQKAKQALSDLIFDKTITYQKVTIDRYGRTIGKIYLGDMYINAAMVANGSAWVYRRYSKDPNLLVLESQARKRQQGLWALPESQRVPPWEWRRN